MSNNIGNTSNDTRTLEHKISEVEEISDDIVTLNEKYSGWLDAMESKYVDKQMDEIDAVERETKQLEQNMSKLIRDIIFIKKTFELEDKILSKIKWGESMKFKFNNKSGARLFERGRQRKVERVEVEINNVVYQIGEDIKLDEGDYFADVKVYYIDGGIEVIKRQQITVDGKDKKVVLDMMSYKHSLLNNILSIKMLVAFIIFLVATMLFGDLGVYSLLIPIFVVSMGNDFYYKRDGFDKTFRAVFK